MLRSLRRATTRRQPFRDAAVARHASSTVAPLMCSTSASSRTIPDISSARSVDLVA